MKNLLQNYFCHHLIMKMCTVIYYDLSRHTESSIITYINNEQPSPFGRATPSLKSGKELNAPLFNRAARILAPSTNTEPSVITYIKNDQSGTSFFGQVPFDRPVAPNPLTNTESSFIPVLFHTESSIMTYIKK